MSTHHNWSWLMCSLSSPVLVWAHSSTRSNVPGSVGIDSIMLLLFRDVSIQVLIPGSFYKKLKNVSCEYNRLNGGNSTLQAAWYIRRVRIIWFLWTKPTIWLLILSFTQNIVRGYSMFYPYEGYRSVTPLDAARVNRTIFHNHSVHWYYITLIKGKYYIKHDINVL